jgi:membrane associated rhomboid family serine protease
MGLFMNGHDKDRDPKDQDESSGPDNVVRIPSLAERDRLRKEQAKMIIDRDLSLKPIINLPLATKWFLGLLIVIHVVLYLMLDPLMRDQIIMVTGFIPLNFMETPFAPAVLVTLITHMFIHGSWIHLAMNGFMLAAFGSGIERWLGAKRMIMLFITCGLFGAAFHYLLNTASPYPMIGASGGLSGLFAAAIVMMNRGQQEIGGRFGILPFALLWIGISIGFGMLGAPGGGAVAWAAHVGGFLGGFVVLKLMRV